jgi:hypothetical protein
MKRVITSALIARALAAFRRVRNETEQRDPEWRDGWSVRPHGQRHGYSTQEGQALVPADVVTSCARLLWTNRTEQQVRDSTGSSRNREQRSEGVTSHS